MGIELLRVSAPPLQDFIILFSQKFRGGGVYGRVQEIYLWESTIKHIQIKPYTHFFLNVLLNITLTRIRVSTQFLAKLHNEHHTKQKKLISHNIINILMAYPV